eukprot:scaffold109906_cov60-Cyclotella_meneghiniana.AAC.1
MTQQYAIDNAVPFVEEMCHVSGITNQASNFHPLCNYFVRARARGTHTLLQPKFSRMLVKLMSKSNKNNDDRSVMCPDEV